ncbi:hypothetical protein PNK_p0101 (plasmid) [Candidatus Protochlamydia naegleriophila]|uniref:Uncharacterized protein n=1 Tax=Candidatus Protochlamydia naegleriophila TaxID=389348 RepID=A0A0U5K7J1_9BACT|nr:hypothetical protein [Candidatus Protochlamydia naegleriophila]CUI18155.1 hypothetical protein PNK_p0101 [Candidatus Protochlamydia naegleriophila]
MFRLTESYSQINPCYQIATEFDDQTLPNNLAILKNESLENIVAGKCDEIFDKILNECLKDKKKAKDLAYALFSGSRCDKFRRQNLSAKGLSYVILDEKLSSSDLCHVIKNAFEDLKKEEIPSDQIISNFKKINGWNGYNGDVYEENEPVMVHHGGGRRHIESFLNGSPDSGYECDSSCQGIFLTVLPKKSDVNLIKTLVMGSRAPIYAKRTPLQHCDDPMVIAGFVQKKYLHTVNYNHYEVILKKEDASQLQIIYSQTISATIEELPYLDKQMFLSKFDQDPDLKFRISQSFNRLYNSCL